VKRVYFKMTGEGAEVIAKPYEITVCGVTLVATKGASPWPWTATEPTTGLVIPMAIGHTKKGLIAEVESVLKKQGKGLKGNIEYSYNENKLTIDLFNEVHNGI